MRYKIAFQRKDGRMNLRATRREKNMTQQQLAELSGCDRTTIGKIETGEITPSVRLAKTIACVLGLDWTSFYKDVVPNNNTAEVERSGGNDGDQNNT